MCTLTLIRFRAALAVADAPLAVARVAPFSVLRVGFGESGLIENEPTAPAEQAHTTRRQ